MVLGAEKLAFAELATRVLRAGRKPMSAALHLSPEGVAASRRAKMLSQVTTSGRRKYMEVPRAAYAAGGATTKAEQQAGKAVTEGLKRAKDARKAEELLQMSKSISKGKTIGGFDPTSGLSTRHISRAVKGLEHQPFSGGSTVIQKGPVKISSFQQGFMDELAKIGAVWR